MRPSVGRIVHYTAYNGKCLAAIITTVMGDIKNTCHLVVFTSMPNVDGKYNGGVQFQFGIEEIREGTENTPGYWHWPERVE